MRRRSRLAQDRLADASAYRRRGRRRGAHHAGLRHGAGRRPPASPPRSRRPSTPPALRRRMRALADRHVAIFLVSASVVGVLWYGAQDVLAGAMTGGRLSQFVLYAVFAASALGELSEVWGELAQAAGAAERLGEILADRAGDRGSRRTRTRCRSRRSARSLSSNVRFAYPTRRRTARRSTGSSFRSRRRARRHRRAVGAGKSTVLQLLLRFYDPQRGRILVDGVPVTRGRSGGAARAAWPSCRRSRRSSPRRVADNIRYGRPDASDAEVRARGRSSPPRTASSAPCRRATNAHRRARRHALGRPAPAHRHRPRHPEGRADPAPRRGDVGARRRERALVQAALDRLMEGRTTLVIAHRLATIRSADRILVMDAAASSRRARTRRCSPRGGLYAGSRALQFTRRGAPAEAARVAGRAAGGSHRSVSFSSMRRLRA